MVNGLISAFSKILNRKARYVSAVIVAAGSSTRMNGIDKIFYLLNEKPLISYSIEAFQKCNYINEIVLVCSASNIEKMKEVCSEFAFSKVKACIKGGDSREESSYIGIMKVNNKSDLVLIHDGARPFVNEQMINEVISAADTYNAATVAIPVTSTTKRVENGFVTDTIDRTNLFEIQTPQCFKSDIIKAGLKNVLDNKIAVTDDCMAVESIGIKPRIVQGSRENIKITVKEDLFIAKSIIENRGKNE